MAEEKKESSGGPVEMAIFVFGGLAFLIFLWFMSGGPERADLRGIFLNAPAPIDDGAAHGPEIVAPEETQ